MSLPVFNQKERNVITLVLLILLGGIMVYAVRGLIAALLGTVVLYTLFRPLNSWLVLRLKWRRSLAAVLIIVLSFVIIVIPFLGIGALLATRVAEALKNPAWITNTVETINEFAGDKLGKPDLLQEQLERSATYLGGLVTKLVSGAAGLFLDIAVMYFLLYFMLTSFRSFERGLSRYSPFKQEHALRFGIEMRNITYSNVIGQTCIAIAQGGALALGFWIFGFPDPLFWGVICAIL